MSDDEEVLVFVRQQTTANAFAITNKKFHYCIFEDCFVSKSIFTTFGAPTLALLTAVKKASIPLDELNKIEIGDEINTFSYYIGHYLKVNGDILGVINLQTTIALLWHLSDKEAVEYINGLFALLKDK